MFGYSKASNTWSVNYRALYNLLPYYKGGNIWRVVESFRHIFAFATHITELTNILIWYAAPNSEFKKKKNKLKLYLIKYINLQIHIVFVIFLC